jgi:hypothetical protein
MSLKVSCTLLSLALAVAAAVAVTPSSAPPTDAASPFKIAAEIISQKYCPTNETEYTIIFKLRIRFTNQTDRKLIVMKDIGHAVYDPLIASDAKNFSEEKFEYNPIIDRDNFFVGPDGKEVEEKLDTPDPNFVILAPGESLEAESVFNVYSVGPLYGFPARRGALQPGNHVLGAWISVWWPYHAKPEDVRKRWEPFGDLIFKSVLVGPLPFNLPPVQKIEKCD